MGLRGWRSLGVGRGGRGRGRGRRRGRRRTRGVAEDGNLGRDHRLENGLCSG